MFGNSISVGTKAEPEVPTRDLRQTLAPQVPAGARFLLLAGVLWRSRTGSYWFIVGGPEQITPIDALEALEKKSGWDVPATSILVKSPSRKNWNARRPLLRRPPIMAAGTLWPAVLPLAGRSSGALMFRFAGTWPGASRRPSRPMAPTATYARISPLSSASRPWCCPSAE